MNFHIGLLLSLAFSAYFIFRDRRRSSGISTASWLPTIWFILAISKPLSYWINPTSFWAGEAGVDVGSGSPVDRAVLTLLMAIGVVELLQRRLHWKELFRKNSLVLLVFAYLALSIAWSAYKPIATKRLFRGFGDVIMALIIVTDASPLEATKMMIKRAGFLLLPLSIILIKYFRTLGVAYDWDGTESWVGVTPQKNSLGILSCVVAVSLAIELIDTLRKRIPLGERFTQLFFLGLAVYLLVKSKSATSLAVFLVGVSLYAVSLFQRTRSSLVGRLYLVLVIGAVIVYYTMLPSLVAALGRNMTFTSRTFIWDAVLSQGRRHPIFGVGYGSLWTGQLGNDLWAQFHVNEAHNGYIEIFATLGIVGLVITAFMIIQAIRNIMRTMDVSFTSGIYRISFVVMILMSNFTETSLVRTTSMLWILFLVVGMQPPDSSFEKPFTLKAIDTDRPVSLNT